MFNGNYKLVKAEIIGDNVDVTTLTAREAADPNTNIGALVTLANGLDKLIVIGEDVYRLLSPVQWNANGRLLSAYNEVVISTLWNAKKLTKEQGNAIIEMLNLRER